MGYHLSWSLCRSHHHSITFYLLLPLYKQTSDVDVALDDGVGDAEYLETIVDILPKVVDAFQPDLVLYDAGVSDRKTKTHKQTDSHTCR